jgi:hypothetical protein
VKGAAREGLRRQVGRRRTQQVEASAGSDGVFEKHQAEGAVGGVGQHRFLLLLLVLAMYGDQKEG